MTLIKSISGIRGTIGGKPGNNLTPADIVRFISAYGTWLKRKKVQDKIKVIVGRDTRISGEFVSQMVMTTLSSLGIDVTHLGPVATPTVEIAVTDERADGGLIITASHNPANWNGLKLLNGLGEFLSADDGNEVLRIAESEKIIYAGVDSLGKIYHNNRSSWKHIERILSLSLVDTDSIRKADFAVAVDGINSVGGIVIPELLKHLGVKKIIELNCDAHGNFNHNPEPLPENLKELSTLVADSKADVGFAVDPDADRLVIVNEDGSMFGEEYTLVAVSDYVLQNQPGNTVSNLSSTRALRDITMKHGMRYFAAPVGEINVVSKMKEVNAVIGGEGNGGVIYPDLHYGRDALAGVALFLSFLARSGTKCSEIRGKYPNYYILKHKVGFKDDIAYHNIIYLLKEKYRQFEMNEEDGLRIDFPDGWVHLRKSNTEPIIRIITEGTTRENAGKILSVIKEFVKHL